ncbi:hypothetical protein GOBAR_AA28071 [Gossypium barbadense]|uniref:Uncharacterized protein n=1 Tax=Gossypium barbadense TaxID=3634 RepID=A0A2P5WNC8_GOSBA|nr:hypothetical protein GOBAR_AA28071 [Gossypium barbadense]
MRFHRNVFVGDMKKKIHPIVIEIDAHGEYGPDNNGCSDYEGDQIINDVSDDINDEGADDGNDHISSIRNSSRGIFIRNDPVDHMSIVDIDAGHVSKFPEYSDIYLLT